MKPSSWKGTYHLISKPCYCCRLSIQVLSQPKLTSSPGFPIHLLLEAWSRGGQPVNLPLLGVLICPWVSSPCVTRVFRRRLFLTEYIESLTIVVESLFTLCGKSFFTKRGESLFTQCGGSRHNFELWCRSSLELFDLWRKWDENNSNNKTQDCMLLSRNAKSSCYEKWSWAMNNHNCWSCYGVMDRDQFQHLDGEASGICRSWLSPMVEPLRLLEVVKISLVPSNNSPSLFNPTFNSLSSSFCSSQRSFASWLFVDISILTTIKINFDNKVLYLYTELNAE